jgi:hypothetical protein
VTTSPRIIVSIHTVHAAMADWHAKFMALAPELRAARNAEQDSVTSQQFADAAAQHMFETLSRHAEKL